MSDYFNLNEGIQNTKKRVSRFSNLSSHRFFNKKAIIPLLIVLAIPLTVGLALVQQETRSRADEISPNRVFVTSALYDGNLGGIEGADAKCQASATAAGIGGVWKAWISDGAISAESRLIHSNNPYQLINGVLVANNWADLVDGSIGKINVTEINTSPGGYVWTNTKSDGSINYTEDTKTCNNWTDNNSSRDGGIGLSTHPISWTNYSTNYCGAKYKLYCVEQIENAGSPTPSSEPTPTPIRYSLKINTPNVIIDAKDFSFTVDGKTYTAENADIVATSDSGSENTTLNANWTDNDGSPINLKIYFRRDPINRNQYEIQKFEITNGQNPPGVMQFFGNRVWGNYGNYGYNGVWQNINLTDTATNSQLHFADVSVFPFALYAVNPSPTPTSKLTPTPTNEPSPTPSPIPTVPVCAQSSIPPQKGAAPLTVTLHGAGIAGGEDSLLNGYQWDFEGNGSWDSEVELNPVNYTYSTPGTYKPKYRILGSNGLWSEICNYPYDVVVNQPTPTTKTLTLNPSADTYVRETSLNKNYGLQKGFRTGTSPRDLAFLQFNLSQLAGKTIKKATLVMKVNEASQQAQTLRRGTQAVWTETGLNYKTRPGFEAVIGTFTPAIANTDVQIPVTNAVNLRKGGNITFGITSAGNDTAVFYSKESAFKPQLIIEYQ